MLVMDASDPVSTKDDQARDPEKLESPSPGSTTPPQGVAKEEPARKLHGIKARY